MVLLHLILNEMSYKGLPLFSAVQEQVSYITASFYIQEMKNE